MLTENTESKLSTTNQSSFIHYTRFAIFLDTQFKAIQNCPYDTESRRFLNESRWVSFEMVFDESAVVNTAFCVTPTKLEIRKGKRTCQQRAKIATSCSSRNAPLPQTSDIPKWAGGGPLSDLVNFFISIKPLFAVMQESARSVIKKSALKQGVDWDGEVERLSREISASEREEALSRCTDSTLEYPSYYLQKFHAYDEGNLNWLASFEQESATYSMALRCFRDVEGINPDMAMKLIRDSHLDAVFSNVSNTFRPKPDEPFVVVDFGCGIGLSCIAMLNRLDSMSPGARIEMLGIDASPYFLVVAEHRRKLAGDENRITYKHGLAEDSKLDNDSCDWVSLQYVIHEMPAPIIAEVFYEAWRIMKPGGVLSFCDNNPQSKTIQNLPPVLFTLMKSTEPWSDSYYRLDVEKLLEQIGFVGVVTIPCDHRHRTVVAVKPQ